MNSLDNYVSRGTGELIDIFYMRQQPSSDLAYTAIMHRFQKDLLQKCEILCGKFGHGVSVAEEVRDNTFISLYRKGKFISGNIRATSVDEEFQIYLYGIARNELCDIYRKQQRDIEGKTYTGEEKIITDLPEDIKIDELKGEALVWFEVINKLPPKVKTVFLTYEAHLKLDTKLPRKLLANLREHLGITQNTIRAYNKEAKDKLEEALKYYRLNNQN